VGLIESGVEDIYLIRDEKFAFNIIKLSLSFALGFSVLFLLVGLLLL